MAAWKTLAGYVVTGGLLMGMATVPAVAQPVNAGSNSETESDAPPPDLQKLTDRLREIDRRLTEIASRQMTPAVRFDDPKFPVLVETCYIGPSYFDSPEGSRFVAVQLVVGNRTGEAVTIERDNIALEADGKTYPAGPVPAAMQNQGFQSGSRGFALRNLPTPEKVTIAAGKTAAAWAIFTKLPLDSDVPAMTLTLPVATQPRTLDLNAYGLAELKLEVARLGPRDALALLTIGGTLESIGAGSLVDELDRLAAQNVARVVVCWSKSATPVDSNLMNWLSQAAMLAGRGEVNNAQFPAIPATIRELHLAEIPGDSQAASSYRQQSPVADLRIHERREDAVGAALRTAYEVLPRDELLREIEQGNPLTRAAALAIGGGRLSAEQLPIVLGYATDDDVPMQRAALIALRHFGEPAAVETLLKFARAESEELSEAAVESLAASRYAVAHEALLSFLKQQPAKPRQMIVRMLARYPRPLWSEMLYEFATSPNSDVNVEALRALVRVGHPRLFDVLKQGLAGDDESIRETAFQLLSSRTDRESEELAVGYALEQLKTSPPNEQIVMLLGRTKDRRAVPLLLARLSDDQGKSREGGAAATIIQLLAQIGDETVAAALVALSPKLSTHEKGAVLNSLAQMKSPSFFELAEPALASEEYALVSAACQGLQADGSSKAVAMLAAALEKSAKQSTWSYICNSLSAIATPQARQILESGRASKNEQKRQLAEAALRNLRQRSPGYQYVYQGQHYARQQEWKTAIEQYSMALKIDADLPDAHAGRANAYLKLDQIDDAEKDFRRAVELDSGNSQAVTGLAVVVTLKGDYEQGIKTIEAVRSRFDDDLLFAYNAACVYGRAIEYLELHAEVKDREQKLAEYRKKALADLKRAIDMGFQDFEWMRKDPDLKPLHGLPEFDRLHEPDAD